ETPPASSEQKSPGQQDTGGPRPAREATAGQAAPSDLQQSISRMPAASLTDLNKGDAVMIVATSGASNGGTVAIILLAGVEPILDASPKHGQSILSPWRLGAAGGMTARP